MPYKKLLVIPVTTMTHDDVVRLFKGPYPFLFPEDVVRLGFRLYGQFMDNPEGVLSFDYIESELYSLYSDELKGYLRNVPEPVVLVEEMLGYDEPQDPMAILLRNISDHIAIATDFFIQGHYYSELETFLFDSEIPMTVKHVRVSHSGILIMLEERNP